MSITILGVDPGLHVTGFGVIQSKKTGIHGVEGGIIQTNPRLPIEQRLKELASDLRDLLRQYSPSVLAVEDLYIHHRYVKTLQ